MGDRSEYTEEYEGEETNYDQSEYTEDPDYDGEDDPRYEPNEEYYDEEPAELLLPQPPAEDRGLLRRCARLHLNPSSNTPTYFGYIFDTGSGLGYSRLHVGSISFCAPASRARSRVAAPGGCAAARPARRAPGCPPV